MLDGNATVGAAGKGMSESQRALELRKFFAPHFEYASTPSEHDFNATLNNDGALCAYAETIVWRLRGVHAMVSLIDRGTQYFLAGAKRTPEEQEEDVATDPSWFGCSTVPTLGGLCENTLALDISSGDYPCFTINDLSQDPRFASLPIVDGSIARYRFYAGAPITTSYGVNIGSFFIFDDKVREGLSFFHRKFLHQQAANVMKHLETKREAAERRRAALMSKGIADFLDRTSRDVDFSHEVPRISDDERMLRDNQPDEFSESKDSTGLNDLSHDLPPQGKESVLDKIRMTLDHAAQIIRESLELTAGGVVFLDTTIGYTENDVIDITTASESTDGTTAEITSTDGANMNLQVSNEDTLRPPLHDGSMGRHLSQGTIRSATDKHKPSKVLAMSAAATATWDPQSRVLDAKTLQSLINAYPKGNVWYIDEDEGYFSSLDQASELEESLGISLSKPQQLRSPSGTNKQNAEAAMLSGIFHKARQIIFLPLWDAGADRWYSGCFVWSQSAVPVFTVESEVAYLSAFTNSMMVEISRLDAITANKVKSDFISSISHEFRSPLHGILASVEFLRDSALSNSQIEFISTIQNCGGTLLDTINHVLDYSKINSFETIGNQQGTISNELFQVTNLALLCEDIVSGMIAANEYRETTQGKIPSTPSDEVFSPSHDENSTAQRAPLDIILDIEHRDWDFRIQAGALRRIVMNIFGNAQKYTESGYVMVQLRVHDTVEENPQYTTGSYSKTLSLRIRDSGRGMSSEYMERKLYHPFAQEDAFSPGVGLGLSIVWSIVNQLGGKIHIRSELGKGTDVEVTIPMDRAETSQDISKVPGDSTESSIEAQECVTSLRRRATGKSVSISRNSAKCGSAHLDALSWDCIERYCSAWFGFDIKTSGGDIIITDGCETTSYPDTQRILSFCGMPCSGKQNKSQDKRPISSICTPIGPFKLARFITALLDMTVPPTKEILSGNRLDAGTQTPLGSPEERKVMNGIILTDYGFPPGGLPQDSTSPKSDDDDDLPNGLRIEVDETSPRSLPPLSPPTPRLTPDQNSSSISPATPTLEFPSVNQSNLTLPSRRSPHAKPALKGLHILAVDDNALNLQLLHRYLQKRKQDTIVLARNGVEAVDAFKSAGLNGILFDVVFMDISMPEMDGFEATRVIRGLESRSSSKSATDLLEEKGDGNGKQKKTYVVALTGLASRRDRDEAERSGFDDFLTKPVSFSKIGEVLGKLDGKKEEKDKDKGCC